MVDPSKCRKSGPSRRHTLNPSSLIERNSQATDNLKVRPHPRDLQIDYTSPTFSIPQKVKFRYRLDGYDNDWHDAGTRRQAFYTDLPPGKYTFRVMAANSDGVWNESAATLDFSIAPAYYQTNWFRAFCVASFLALLWAAVPTACCGNWRGSSTCAWKSGSASERASHAICTTRCCKVSTVFCSTCKAGIHLLPEHPAEAKKTFEDAVDQAERAIVEGREAVQGLRASTVERNDLALAIKTLGGELAAADSRLHRPEFRCSGGGHAAQSASDSSRRSLPNCRGSACATPSVTRTRSKSKWKSTMTSGRYGCESAMMARASTRSS